MARSPAQQGPDAGQHFLNMKRFCQIIIRARINARYLVGPAVPRRQDQNRHVPAIPPPLLQHRDTIHCGQAQVQYDRIIGLRIAQKMPLFPVMGQIHRIARIDQGPA